MQWFLWGLLGFRASGTFGYAGSFGNVSELERVAWRQWEGISGYCVVVILSSRRKSLGVSREGGDWRLVSYLLLLYVGLEMVVGLNMDIQFD